MVLITLMVFNALIMAISLSQPNSPHSTNETPGLHSINEAPGLLHSISTQRHTTFRGTPDRISDHSSLSSIHTQTPRDSTSPPPDQELSPDSWVPTPP